MTIDTDAHNELAAQYKIASLPTVIAFRNGKVVGKFVGSRNENAVLDFMTSLPVKAGAV
jgi:thioredoxin 1